MFRKKEKMRAKDFAKIFGPAAVLTIIGFFIAYQFVAPAPPKHLVIGTGPPESAYYFYGKAYSEILARDGIALELKTTAGSAENLEQLESETDGIDIAFVQSGMQHLAGTGGLVSLGSLYFEPMWIFHHAGLELRRLTDLKGLRVAVGGEGSGTKVLVMQLLELNGITPENTRILSFGGAAATDMLLNGELDVGIFVTTHRTDHIKKLFRSRSISLMGIERAEAYALRYHYLYVLKLPEGVIDFEANIPSRDLAMIAPTTQLVARSDLHPALISLLIQAGEEIFKKGGAFEKEGEFPSPKYLDFELSEEAKRFYESGPSFLRRYLPFWVANFLKRITVMLLPFAMLLFPFFKLMPSVYRWRMRSRIYRWYSRLDAIDPGINKMALPDRIDEYLSELDGLEEKVARISVPLAYTEELYHLRMHIDLLRKSLLREREKKNSAK
jgi:TRAP transporter TAXI family solute receptor